MLQRTRQIQTTRIFTGTKVSIFQFDNFISEKEFRYIQKALEFHPFHFNNDKDFTKKIKSNYAWEINTVIYTHSLNESTIFTMHIWAISQQKLLANEVYTVLLINTDIQLFNCHWLVHLNDKNKRMLNCNVQNQQKWIEWALKWLNITDGKNYIKVYEYTYTFFIERCQLIKTEGLWHTFSLFINTSKQLSK